MRNRKRRIRIRKNKEKKKMTLNLIQLKAMIITTRNLIRINKKAKNKRAKLTFEA